MFITIRFGKDNHQIFNPDCSIINFVADIKRRCLLEYAHQGLDLADETGLLMGISTAAGQERALSYLKPLCTYILMEKRVIPAVRNFPIMISNASTSQSFSRSSKSKTNETEFSTNETCKDLYFPLLLGVNKIYPDFHFHKTIQEKNTFNQRKSKGSKYVCGQSVNHLGISQLKSMSTTSRKSITSVKTLPKRIYSNYARRLTLM